MFPVVHNLILTPAIYRWIQLWTVGQQSRLTLALYPCFSGCRSWFFSTKHQTIWHGGPWSLLRVHWSLVYIQYSLSSLWRHSFPPFPSMTLTNYQLMFTRLHTRNRYGHAVDPPSRISSHWPSCGWYRQPSKLVLTVKKYAWSSIYSLPSLSSIISRNWVEGGVMANPLHPYFCTLQFKSVRWKRTTRWGKVHLILLSNILTLQTCRRQYLFDCFDTRGQLPSKGHLCCDKCRSDCDCGCKNDPNFVFEWPDWSVPNVQPRTLADQLDILNVFMPT